MRKIFFLIAFCIGFIGFAQNQPPKMPKYIPKDAAGIFYYNVVEATKKIKLKKEDTKLRFSKVIRSYNDDIKEIAFLNSANLNEVELTVNSMGKEAFTNPEIRNRLRKLIADKVSPVRDSVLKREEKLNEDLTSFLSKKQLKKWMRYQRSQKEKLIPKPPQDNRNRNNPNNNRMLNRGMGGGFGGGRRF